MQLSSSKKKTKRIGRGGKRGRKCGRGTKGQKSRAGHSIRPAFRDVIEKLPKLRGHNKNRAKGVHTGRVRIVALNVAQLEELSVVKITPQYLVKAGLVMMYKGRKPYVKILGNGEIKRKITISDCMVSKVAKEKIAKAGGVVHTKK